MTQYPSHYDISALLDPLPNLCALSIVYGRKRLGMEYERGLFGMKIVDAQYLVRYIRCCQTLVKLALPCNMIDDELVKIVMGGLETCVMLTDLDLSHNNIGDRGARRLAKLLDRPYVLHSLDLSDNVIHANGCMHLGAHLADNMTLEHLNLRLNRSEDNGRWRLGRAGGMVFSSGRSGSCAGGYTELDLRRKKIPPKVFAICCRTSASTSA